VVWYKRPLALGLAVLFLTALLNYHLLVKMGLDIRLPMGIMFSLLGGLLFLYGLYSGADPMYAKHSLGVNVNLWWGLFLIVFGR
jgi:hypothetical protein